jgi:hypothetical protein
LLVELQQLPLLVVLLLLPLVLPYHLLPLPQVPDPNIFSSRIQHEKWNANLIFSCLLWFQEQSLYIRNPEKIHAGSGGRKSTGAGSATFSGRVFLFVNETPPDGGAGGGIASRDIEIVITEK